LTVEPKTNVEGGQLTLRFSRPSSNVSIHDIEHASQTNDAISHFEGINCQLNEASQRRQDLLFEVKLAEFNERYRQSRSATARSRIYHELTREIDILEQEERREDEVQDPPEMKGPRTFGRGGPRRKTAAELAMKELERHDRPTLRPQHQSQPSTSRQLNCQLAPASAKNIVGGLISGAHLPAAELARVVMMRDPLIVDLTDSSPVAHDLSASVTSVVKTISQRQGSASDPYTPLATQSTYTISDRSAQIRDTDQEIEVLEREELQAERNSTPRGRPILCRRKRKHSLTEVPVSPSRPKRNVKLPRRYH